MYILYAYGEEIPCKKAIKGHDYIEIHLSDDDIRTDSGITDFSGYSLTDENGNPVDFSWPEPTMEEQVKAMSAAFIEMAGEIYG